MEDTSCLILAGGLGTRLRPIIGNNVPKVLAEINGEPHLYQLVRNLDNLGLKEIVLSLGHLASSVSSALPGIKSKTPLRAIFEKTPLGTGGAVINSLQEIQSENILVVNGDTIVSFSLQDLKDLLSNEIDAVALVAPVLAKNEDGNVELSNEYITSIGLVKDTLSLKFRHAGVTLIKKRAMEDHKYPDPPFDFELYVLGPIVGRKSLKAKIGKTFIDFGTPEDYRKANL